MKKKEQFLTRKEITKALKANREILKRYTVRRLGLFGSYVRGQERKKSDIDLVVEFENPSFDNFMDLSFYLESLFGRKVDLITNGSLSVYIQPYVEREIEWHEIR